MYLSTHLGWLIVPQGALESSHVYVVQRKWGSVLEHCPIKFHFQDCGETINKSDKGHFVGFLLFIRAFHNNKNQVSLSKDMCT